MTVRKRVRWDDEKLKNKVSELGYVLNLWFRKKNHILLDITDRDSYRYLVQLDNLLSSDRNIKNVHKKNPYSLENIANWLKINRPDIVLLEGNIYKSYFEKLNLYHLECGEKFKMGWGSLFVFTGCPACSSPPKIVTDRNRLSLFFPFVSKDWHPYKNKPLTPHDVSYGSHKNVWWKCNKKHEYRASITERTRGKGCPECSELEHDSRIARELKNYFYKYNCETEYRILKSKYTGRWLPYDIYIPCGKDKKINGVYIEIHGQQHYIFDGYFNKTEEEFLKLRLHDKLKKIFAKENGLYIEIDLRKIKTLEAALNHIKKQRGKNK